MSVATESFALTKEEVSFFLENGYLGPLTAFTPEEMERLRPQVDGVLAEQGHATCIHHNGKPVDPWQGRHLDRRVVWDLCSHPAVVERMASIMGPDLVLWRSNFFVKAPGAKVIPWHQDRNYWPITPEVNISAWMAIDPATRENSCVEILPGSHKQIVRHIKSTPEMGFAEMAATEGLDFSKKVVMELKPGQFFLFNEATLHHSEPNRSAKRRCGLAIRVTVPCVRVFHHKLYKGHKCVLLRGEDRCGFNEMAEPPVA